MKKQKSAWWQPEGWMAFGAYVAVGLVILYLIFVVVSQILPRIRKIGSVYDSAQRGRAAAKVAEWRSSEVMEFAPAPAIRSVSSAGGRGHAVLTN